LKSFIIQFVNTKLEKSFYGDTKREGRINIGLNTVEITKKGEKWPKRTKLVPGSPEKNLGADRGRGRPRTKSFEQKNVREKTSGGKKFSTRGGIFCVRRRPPSMCRRTGGP